MNDNRPPVLIVEARFYEDIADSLAKGASAVLENAGVPYERLEVPGVFEIPAAIRFAIRAMEVQTATNRYAGFIALGCVIKGATDHYDFICTETSRALMELSIKYTVAMGFGVLTCPNYDLAWERADVAQKNKGAEAAEACLRMMALKREFRLAPG